MIGVVGQAAEVGDGRGEPYTFRSVATVLAADEICLLETGERRFLITRGVPRTPPIPIRHAGPGMRAGRVHCAANLDSSHPARSLHACR